MTANPWTGEVCLTIDGKPHQLKLTLGALAGLENELRSGSLLDLAERFETGRFTARDIILLLSAGLHGGGSEIAPERLAQADIEGGAIGAARVAGRLLALAFGHGAPGS